MTRLTQTPLNMTTEKVYDEEAYELALKKIRQLIRQNPAANSAEGKELEMLVTLVEAYEEIYYPLPFTEPIMYLKSVMEERNLKQTDLIPFIGTKSEVSKILNGKRELTISMIRNLAKGLHLPVQRLV